MLNIQDSAVSGEEKPTSDSHAPVEMGSSMYTVVFY